MSQVLEALLEQFVADHAGTAAPLLVEEQPRHNEMADLEMDQTARTAAVLKSIDAALDKISQAELLLAGKEVPPSATSQDAVNEIRQQVAALSAIVIKPTGTGKLR